MKEIPGLFRGICRERHIFSAFLVCFLIDTLADGAFELQCTFNGVLACFGIEDHRVGMEVEIEVVACFSEGEHSVASMRVPAVKDDSSDSSPSLLTDRVSSIPGILFREPGTESLTENPMNFLPSPATRIVADLLMTPLIVACTFIILFCFNDE